mgnify:CR=1 FL=1
MSSNSEQHRVFKSFSFGVGDTIYIEYDPFASKLRFRKNDSKDKQDSYELDIIPVPVNNIYYACASLAFLDDSVEIVPGEPISLRSV